MAIPSKPSYSHGSTGTEPSSAIDYKNGDPLDEAELDYYVNTEFSKIKAIIDALHDLDSDDDGVVDRADYADDADASTYKGNDIDSDGDGSVNLADNADKVDGTHLADVTWADVALAQSDVDITDINPADGNLDMNGNVIENTGGVVLPVGKDQWA
jgi:hypothetical protein